MQKIQTSDAVEAQRCRRAQYSGLPTTITLNGLTIRGIVQSVREENRALWIVTVIPKVQKIFTLPRHKPSYTG